MRGIPPPAPEEASVRKIVIALTSSAPSGAASAHPWTDRSLSPQKRAELLVAQMTLDEKVQEIQPPRQLRGFAKVTRRPGQAKHLVLTLDPRSFSVWDTAAGRWATIPGRYTIFAGDSYRDLPVHQTVNVRR
jgi:beta-glucosidase